MGIGVAGVAGLAASACRVNNPASDDKPSKSAAELTPDVAVATRALAQIRAARTAASSTLTRFPAFRAQLAPLVAMHQAHEVSLADAVPDRADPSATPTPYDVPRKSAIALRKLTTREQQLHATLDALALRAQSGDFARLLASMGAGVGQRLAGWQP